MMSSATADDVGVDEPCILEVSEKIAFEVTLINEGTSVEEALLVDTSELVPEIINEKNKKLK